MMRLILLLLCTSHTLADNTSLHTAMEEAINKVISNGCYEIDIVMPASERYTVDSQGVIKGASFRVKCLREVEGSSEAITLSWNAPTTRENGDPLLTSEIEGYIISHKLDGNFIGEVSTQGGSHSLRSASGENCFSIKTLDKGGLMSRPSGEVCIIM